MPLDSLETPIGVAGYPVAMDNDPRIAPAVGMLTAFMHGDREGFDEISAEYEGGCSEALAALARVTEAIVKMFAQAAEKTPAEMLSIIATAIA